MPTLLTVQIGLDRIVRESGTRDCERPASTTVILDTVVVSNHEHGDSPRSYDVHEGSKRVPRGLPSPTSARYSGT